MKKYAIIVMAAVVGYISAVNCALGKSDWEYWSRYSFEVPVVSNISVVVKPEWRIRNDMSYRYMYKQEQAIVFKLGRFFDVAPYYVWQETRSAQGEDQSNLIYLDLTAKTSPLPGGFTINDRLRYQYDFTKAYTTWRNSLRLARPFRLSQWQIAPFVEDEVFYDAPSGQINRNWASVGIGVIPCRWVNISLAYLLDSKKQNDQWTDANVLVSTVNLKW